jgi:hypothetical protein
MHHPTGVPSRIDSRRCGADPFDAVDMTRSSAFTVAGTVPDFHRIPFSAFTGTFTRQNPICCCSFINKQQNIVFVLKYHGVTEVVNTCGTKRGERGNEAELREISPLQPPLQMFMMSEKRG